MTNTILTPSQATARQMRPLTQASDRDGAFIRNVSSDMRRVRGTRWAMVKPETKEAQESPNLVEIWRVMIPLP